MAEAGTDAALLGLTAEEAAGRLAADGPNELADRKSGATCCKRPGMSCASPCCCCSSVPAW